MTLRTLSKLRSRAHGLGIPEIPTDANMKRVLVYLHIDSRTRWLTGQTLTPLASDKISWADGFNAYSYDDNH